MVKYYYVYILKCSDNTYYTGITNNPERRVIEHASGTNPKSYTFNRRPVQCIYVSEPFLEPLKAIAWEKQLKDWNRKKKEAFIRGEFHLLPGLSKSKHRE